MPRMVDCPHCQTKLRLVEGFSEKSFLCPGCKKKVLANDRENQAEPPEITPLAPSIFEVEIPPAAENQPIPSETKIESGEGGKTQGKKRSQKPGLKKHLEGSDLLWILLGGLMLVLAAGVLALHWLKPGALFSRQSFALLQLAKVPITAVFFFHCPADLPSTHGDR
ncbi:MAG: hypothetical protein EXR99_06755 [Gemmataceae bacterium]|nr:hypothetical protein [Gemmataceae bacterium]